MRTSEMVKEEIRTINPEITDELLDLLYEYIKLKKDEKDIESMNNEPAAIETRKVMENILNNCSKIQ